MGEALSACERAIRDMQNPQDADTPALPSSLWASPEFSALKDLLIKHRTRVMEGGRASGDTATVLLDPSLYPEIYKKSGKLRFMLMGTYCEWTEL